MYTVIDFMLRHDGFEK